MQHVSNFFLIEQYYHIAVFSTAIITQSPAHTGQESKPQEIPTEATTEDVEGGQADKEQISSASIHRHLKQRAARLFPACCGDRYCPLLHPPSAHASCLSGESGSH